MCWTVFGLLSGRIFGQQSSWFLVKTSTNAFEGPGDATRPVAVVDVGDVGQQAYVGMATAGEAVPDEVAASAIADSTELLGGMAPSAHDGA